METKEYNPAEDFLPPEAKGVPREQPTAVIFMDEAMDGSTNLPRLSGPSAIESVFDAPGVKISHGEIVGTLAPGSGRSQGPMNFRNAEEYARETHPVFTCKKDGGSGTWINARTVRCDRCGTLYDFDRNRKG